MRIISTLKRNLIMKIIMKIAAETEESHEYVSLIVTCRGKMKILISESKWRPSLHIKGRRNVEHDSYTQEEENQGEVLHSLPS